MRSSAGLFPGESRELLIRKLFIGFKGRIPGRIRPGIERVDKVDNALGKGLSLSQPYPVPRTPQPAPRRLLPRSEPMRMSSVPP